MHEHEEKKETLKNALVKVGILVLIVAAVSITAEHVGQGHLTRLMDWIQRQGAVAPLVFGFMNVIGVVAFIPQTIFTLAAGMLFGPIMGAGVSMAGLAVGAVICFLISRHGGKGYVEKKFGHLDTFRKINLLSEKHPLKMVAISRLVPIFPIPLLSYIWGLTRVSFMPYLILTLICPLPETVFLTTGGHLLRVGVTAGRLDATSMGILAGAGLLLVLVVIQAKKALKSVDDSDKK